MGERGRENEQVAVFNVNERKGLSTFSVATRRTEKFLLHTHSVISTCPPRFRAPGYLGDCCDKSVLYYERLKAESEAQRGKPEGTLESEIRSAI